MRCLKIAVADDDAAVRAVVAAWLTKLGHLVVAVADGRELIDVCRSGDFDLAVSDVEMGDPDGLEAAAVVRRECGLPVVLLSGGWTPDRRQQARMVGAFMLNKPLLPLALVAVLEEASRRAELAAV